MAGEPVSVKRILFGKGEQVTKQVTRSSTTVTIKPWRRRIISGAVNIKRQVGCLFWHNQCYALSSAKQ